MKIDDIQNEIINDMSELDDWLDKYEYLVKLGKEFKPVSTEIINEKNSLPGCQSRVWITAELKEGKVQYDAESDSAITRGIIALLLKTLNNHTPEEIQEAKLFFIHKVGLSTNLSPSRANGLAAIVARLKTLAETCRETDH